MNIKPGQDVNTEVQVLRTIEVIPIITVFLPKVDQKSRKLSINIAFPFFMPKLLSCANVASYSPVYIRHLSNT